MTTLTSAQIRASRSMLRWDQADLTEKSGVSLATIKRLEKMEGVVKGNRVTIEAIARAFTDAGVGFINDDDSIGVKLKK